MNQSIDLRSDTVTKPSPQMLDFMYKAQVGDDVFKEDPTVNELESFLASYFGVDQALFFPTGTMANQVAIKLHTQPGDQVICDQYAHIYNYEGGGASFNSGVSCKLLQGVRGIFSVDQVKEAINPPDFYHSPKTRLLEIENTTNKGGGACWDFKKLEKMREICNQNYLGFHLDGARLWNAFRVKPDSPQMYGALFDTISVCLSKGLGCPMGSVLLGKKEIMEGAIRIRKILGGGMRQMGYMAAAGLYALENNIERLDEDHKKAMELANALHNFKGIKNVFPVETNIVIFEVDAQEREKFMEIFTQNQIQISDMGGNLLRMVTHMDYSDTMHKKVLSVLI